MQVYNITIFKQSRILISLFLLPVLLLISLFIGAEIHSFIIPILFLIISFLLIYYFIVGHLIITIKNDKLIFDWKRKLIFNYKHIQCINISDIKTVVLDGEFLRKIKTDNIIIYINNSKIKPKDANEFIAKLKTYKDKYGIEIIDSWDEFARNGYLRIAYIFNSILIIVSIILIITISILKGFKPVSLSLLLLFIPQMILYRQQMRDKINR